MRVYHLIFILVFITSCTLFKPKEEVDIFKKGNELYKQEKYKEALMEYKKIVEKDEKNYKAHYYLGCCYTKLGNYKAAEKEFNEVIALNPDSNEAKLAQQYLATLPKERIVEEIEKKEVESLIKPVIVKPYELPKFKKERKAEAYKYYKAGVRNANEGKWSLAIANLEKAIEIDDTYAPAYTQLGIGYAKKGDYDKAIATLQKATNLDPENLIAHYNLGAIYEGKSLWQLAINEYMKVLTLDPNNVEVRTRLGICFMENNNRSAAMDQWNIATTIDPNYLPARLLLAKIYAEVGEAPFRPVTYTLTYKEDTHMLTYEREVETELKDYLFYDAAIEEYRQALRIDPNCAEAHYGLGTTYAHAAQKDVRVFYTDGLIHRDKYSGKVRYKMTIGEMLDKALYHLKKAVKLEPYNPYYHINLGVVYGEMGLYEKAKEELKYALKLDDRLTAAYANLAVIYSYQGAIKLAQKAYKKIAKIDPEKVRAQEALRLLQPTVAVAPPPEVKPPTPFAPPSAPPPTPTESKP